MGAALGLSRGEAAQERGTKRPATDDAEIIRRLSEQVEDLRAEQKHSRRAARRPPPADDDDDDIPAPGAGGVTASGIQEMVQKALLEALGGRGRPGATVAAQPARPPRLPDTVKPGMHSDFLRWLGAGGNIKQTMPRPEWLKHVAKKWTLAGWRERAESVDVDVPEDPDSKEQLVEALLTAWLAQTAPASDAEDNGRDGPARR